MKIEELAKVAEEAHDALQDTRSLAESSYKAIARAVALKVLEEAAISIAACENDARLGSIQHGFPENVKKELAGWKGAFNFAANELRSIAKELSCP